MPEISDVLKQFGPTGLTIVMMGYGLIYLTKWLREMQDQSGQQHDKVRAEFTQTLKDYRDEHTTALKDIVTEFKSMHTELGGKVDQLSNRVDNLGNALRK